MKKQKRTDPFALPMPKLKKHRLIKALILVSFFVGAKELAFPKNTNSLPYNDNQSIPPVNPGSLTSQELELAKQAYAHLLSVLYTKCQNMGISLESGYLIEIVAYDYMNDSIDVILQKDNDAIHLTFSSERLSDRSVNLGKGSPSDQISALTNMLNVPLLAVPVKTKLSGVLSSTLKNNISANVNHFARTGVGFSNGDLRTENEEYGLIAGRDYYYFNVYGTGKKDGADYNVVTTVAMKADDTEILEVNNLIEYYIASPDDERFVINMLYQESLQTLKMLNEQQSVFEFEA